MLLPKKLIYSLTYANLDCERVKNMTIGDKNTQKNIYINQKNEKKLSFYYGVSNLCQKQFL